MKRNRTRPQLRGTAHRCALGFAAILLGGCSIGPKYVRPTAPTPTAYKEPGDEWKQAAPSDAIAKGRWWEIYGDPQLSSLEDQVTSANQSLKAAQDAYAVARAAVRQTRSQYYPTVSVVPQVSGQRVARNSPSFNAGEQTYDNLQIPFEVSYEPDLWGRVRRDRKSVV